MSLTRHLAYPELLFSLLISTKTKMNMLTRENGQIVSNRSADDAAISSAVGLSRTTMMHSILPLAASPKLRLQQGKKTFLFVFFPSFLRGDLYGAISLHFNSQADILATIIHAGKEKRNCKLQWIEGRSAWRDSQGT